jgi:surface protein
MFRGASYRGDIEDWDVSNVTDMSQMFKNADQFNRDLGEWNVSNVTNMSEIFAGTVGLQPQNYDALLIGWNRRDLPDGVIFDASSLRYSPAAADDRQEISSDDNWTFNDCCTEDEFPSPSLIGGSSYDPPTPTSGTDDNPVGRLKMDVNDFAYGAVIDRIVLTANGSDQGVKAVSVWNSSQSTFDAGTAQRLTEKSLDPTTEVPPTLTMTDLDQMLPSNGSTYFYVTYDLAASASVDGDLLLADSTDATLYRAVVSNAASTFPLALSSSTTTPSTVSSKTVSGDTTATFGDTGSTLNFSGVSTSGGVTVSRYDEGPSNTDGISESNVSSYRLTIDADSDLSFNSAQVQFAVSMLPGISDPDAVTIYKRDTEGSGSFNALTTTVGDNNTPDDVTDDTLYASTTSFSEFAFASDSEPLPVEMTGFDAQVDDGSVQLSWTTTSETNNAGFRIQRRTGTSNDAGSTNSGEPSRRDASTRTKDWQTVGTVDGAGTTAEAQSYQFTDEDLPFEADALTYRLKQVDTDGSAQYTETTTVERGVKSVQLLGTYPNPARQKATLNYALPEKQETTIRLYDVLGRQVRTVVSEKKEGRHEQTLDVSTLSSGVYFLRLRSEGTIKTQKLTIVR